MPISAAFSERELEKVWTLPESIQGRLLRPALAKLYEDPNVSEAYLTDWTWMLRESVEVALGKPISTLTRVIPVPGHAQFLQSCTDAGLADAMLKLVELTTPASARARIYALSIWSGLTAIASTNSEQRAQIRKDRVNIKACLLKALESNMFMQRAQAVLCLRQFALGPWATDLSCEDVAEIMIGCLRYAGADHQSVVDELNTRDGSWQRELMRDVNSISDVFSTDEALVFAPRFYSQSRDESLKAVADLLDTRQIRRARKDCLEIIRVRPGILDQLLTIVCFDRTPWHPESSAYATAARILTYMLQTPHYTIPELWDDTVSNNVTDFRSGTHGGHDIQYLTDEWIRSVEVLQEFLEKCARWRPRLLEKWRVLQNETRADILRKFRQTSKYLAVREPDTADFERTISDRGVCRSCILRIFINLTNGGFQYDPEDSILVSTAELLSLLPVAYEASQKVPSESKAKRRTNGARSRDALLRLERTTDVVVVHQSSFHRHASLAHGVIFSEYILGPVLLFRILRRINESHSKYFRADRDVGSWTTLPAGTPEDTYLAQIRQIASPDVLDVLMRNAVLKRIPLQKEEGTHRLRQMQEETDRNVAVDRARAAYLAAAELAIAVDQFCASVGPYKEDWRDMTVSVKKERVACLGNVSEMSSRLGDWNSQYWYARHAIDTLDQAKFDVLAARRDGWDPEEMRAKNERRLTTAKRNILARHSLH